MTHNFCNPDAHIIVVGSGIGGLCAAAAVAHHVARVTLIEKDALPAIPTIRKSAPQAHHIHILLQAGLNMLNELFPDLTEELIANGAAQIEAGEGQQIYEFGSWSAKRPLGFQFLGLSRAFLEHSLIGRIKQMAQIEIKDHWRVRKTLMDNGAVVGLRIQDAKGEEFDLQCDGVIDAAGGGSPLLNQAVPDMDSIVTDEQKIDIFYSTVFFKKAPQWRGTCENILVVPQSHTELGASLIDIENDYTCLSLHGGAACEAPKGLDDWFFQVKNLPNDVIWQRIKNAELSSDIHIFRKPRALWRHFEKSPEKLARNYLPIGDVISQMNPIFGQGMTVVVGHAVSLKLALDQSLAYEEFLQHYLDGAAAWSSRAWRKAAGYNAMLGMEDPRHRIFNQLAKQKFLRARDDAELHRILVSQSQMLL